MQCHNWLTFPQPSTKCVTVRRVLPVWAESYHPHSRVIILYSAYTVADTWNTAATPLMNICKIPVITKSFLHSFINTTTALFTNVKLPDVALASSQVKIPCSRSVSFRYATLQYLLNCGQSETAIALLSRCMCACTCVCVRECACPQILCPPLFWHHWHLAIILCNFFRGDDKILSFLRISRAFQNARQLNKHFSDCVHHH